MSGGKYMAAVDAANKESSVNTTDRLNYMADMLLEMRDMADHEGCKTLSGLLELAQAEARLKAQNGRT